MSLLLITLVNLFAEEYKSLVELRTEYGEAYGPSFEEILPVTFDDFVKCKGAYVYHTKTAVEIKYAGLCRSIAGREIVSIGEGVNAEKLIKLLRFAKNYNSYGDFGPRINPDLAIELVFENEVFVLNFDSKLKMANYSSHKCDEYGELVKWTRPTKVSPVFAKFLENLHPKNVPNQE